MPKSSDGCLERPGQKTAGVTIYLMEELGDARLRCDQLVRYLDEAVKLIEKSSHKDHFFEVAGHLIQSVPDTAFKLQKALQAVALAADRLDYEELKQELRPEKVEELERVLKEVRIRQVQHRSEPGATPMTPQKAAQRLREIAKTAREEGSLPLHDLASLVRDLTPSRKAHDAIPAADTLEKMASALESSDKISRGQLSALLSRIAMEAEFNMALKLASRPRLTQEMMQLGDVEEVKKKFKSENPDISDADLNEIAKQWQTNKDVVKDKSADYGDAVDNNYEVTGFSDIQVIAISANRNAKASRWRPALMGLFNIVDTIGTILVNLGSMDAPQKAEALKREIRQAIPGAARAIEENEETALVMASWKAATSDDDKRSKFEEGKPADPTENLSPEDAKRWKEEHEKHKDNFKGADTADEARRSRFEQGKPADPTENLNPADAKEWKEQHDKHKDNFKGADAWKA